LTNAKNSPNPFIEFRLVLSPIAVSRNVHHDIPDIHRIAVVARITGTPDDTALRGTKPASCLD